MDVRTFIEDIAEDGRQNLHREAARNNRIGSMVQGYEEEKPHVSGLQMLTADAYQEALNELAGSRFADPVYDDSGRVKAVEFGNDPVFDDTSVTGVPGFDYDYGPEAETQTGAVTRIEDGYEQLDLADDLLADAIPDDSALLQQGIAPELAAPDLFEEDTITWDVDEGAFRDWMEEEYDTDRIATWSTDHPVRNWLAYQNQGDVYDNLSWYFTPLNMQLGATGSLHFTANPFSAYADIDESFARLNGGDDFPSIHALSPLIFGPFMNSARFSAEDGIETRYARDDAYRSGRTESPLLDADESADLFGYPSVAGDVESIEDWVEWVVEQPAPKLSVPRESVYPLDDRLPLPDQQELSVVPARFGETFEPVYFDEIVEDEYFTGLIHRTDSSGDLYKQFVEVDADEDTIKNLYGDQEGTLLPSYRFKLDVGVGEYRDICNGPYREEAVAWLNGIFYDPFHFQELATGDGFDITEDDAEELRRRIPQEGLDAELPGGQTYRDFLQTVLDDGTVLDGARQYARTSKPAQQLGQYLERAIDPEEPDTPADELYETVMGDLPEDDDRDDMRTRLEDAYHRDAVTPQHPRRSSHRWRSYLPSGT